VSPGLKASMIEDGNMENGNDLPATKRDFEEFKVEVNIPFEAFEQRIGQILHDTEARVLQAFCGFAGATNKRLDQTDWNLAICTDRLETIESRLLEVEKRLNIPPTH